MKNYKLELPIEIIDFFEPKSDTDLEVYDQDIRTCSYLHRDESGNYSFAIKRSWNSFVEKQEQAKIQ